MKNNMVKNMLAISLISVILSWSAQAEILALANYESKPDDSLKDLKMPFGTNARREGVAVFDVDPESDNYGNILMDIPLPADLVAHHVFWNKDHTKLYMTSLMKPEVRVIDTTQNPYRVKVIDVPDCVMGEDVVFSADNTKWYETCMGSNNIMVGDAVNDTFSHVIASPVNYPHGIMVHEGIDRMLVSSTVRGSDLADAGNSLGVIELSTGKGLGEVSTTDKPEPNNIAPVEILWVPGTEPPIAWVTNMYDGTLWVVSWNAETQGFDSQPGFDFGPLEAGIPLEIYFNADGSQMHVTTANPGKMHFFEMSDDRKSATHTKAIDTAGGAHHVAYTKDGKYAYVQNSFINLPGMSDGSISVVDLASKEVIDVLGTFKDNGFNPNCLVLLSEWNDPMGH
ncbi:MAG: DNA-binding beta-propeller fold protein YncE [Lysobacterales bacterium]|jgi:DNA-binding beta-propeller fold protein YncE